MMEVKSEGPKERSASRNNTRQNEVPRMPPNRKNDLRGECHLPSPTWPLLAAYALCSALHLTCVHRGFTRSCQNKGNTNSVLLGRWPPQAARTASMCLGIDSTSFCNNIGGMRCHSSVRNSINGFLLMVVETAVSGAAPESPLCVQFGWDLVTGRHTHTHTRVPVREMLQKDFNSP
jgi:hypothetical protein